MAVTAHWLLKIISQVIFISLCWTLRRIMGDWYDDNVGQEWVAL
jgi:hypothetical protein